MSFGDSPLVNPSPVLPSSSNSFNQPPINPSNDSSSLYYLHPSDNPGALLVSEIFNGENYVQFIDGSIVSPSTDQLVKHTTWLRANNPVLSCKISRSDGPRVFQLEKSLSCIIKVLYLWDEYISYRPFPTCTCGKMATCTCELFNFLQIDSNRLCTQILGGVFSLASRRKSRQLTNSATCNETHALMAKQSNQQSYQPQSFKDKPKKSALHVLIVAIIVTGGQMFSTSWLSPVGMDQKEKEIWLAHVAITTPKVPNQNSNEQQKFSVNLVTTSHFSGKVQPTLKPIFSCNSVTSKPNSTSYWLLDTGATDHMICSPLLYHSTPKPINASINLPNGTTVPATHIGPVNGEDDWDCS
ncbi:hypothetical protein AAG906_018607 [Vitis piasezkii]